MERLINKQTLKGCNGVFYRDKQVVIKNEERVIEHNIENFGYPDREIILPYEINEFNITFPVLTTRGCKGKCTFSVADNKGEVRVRSLNNVFDEIDELIKKYNASFINFIDSSFEDGGSTPIDRFNELLLTLKERRTNIRFSLNCRAESINTETIEILQELVDYGLNLLMIGIEAGNEADLKIYAKKASLNDNIYALKLLSGTRIPFRPEFIMFNPYSTFSGLREKATLLNRFDLMDNFDIIDVRFQVFSGAPLTKKLFSDGLVLDNVIYPITNGMCYCFMDSRIKHVCNVVQVIKLRAPILDKLNRQELINIFSIAGRINNYRSPFKKDERVIEFIEILNNYKKDINLSYFSLFNKILDLAERKEDDIIKVLDKDISDLNEILEMYWKLINKSKLIILKILFKAHVLPLRNN